MKGSITPRQSLFFLSLALIAVTFLTYSNSAGNDFVWDDRNFIIENPFVHSFSHWRELLTHNIGYSAGARNNFYRPLYSLLNMLNYKMGNGTPPIFHVTNTLIHTLCAVLVLIFIYLIFNNILVAFTTAILFALHPVQTQAVTYIAGRADPIYLCFTLTSIICFIVYLRNRKNVFIYFISIVSFALALLSKEAAIITPFLMLLYIYTVPEKTIEQKRKGSLVLIPHFLVLCLYLLSRATILDFSKIAYSTLSLPSIPFNIRAITACKAIFLYFRFLFIPVGFHMETHLPNSISVMESETFFAVIGVILIVGLLLYTRRRNKFFFFGLSWFFLGLLPVLNLFPVNAAMAVHWLYLPSIGFFFILSLILWTFLQKKRIYIFIAVIILSFLLGALTYNRNKDWKNEETLYNSILPFSQTPRIYVNLGNIFARKGELDKAVDYYLKAMKMAPGQTEIYVNLGYIYSEKKEFKKAEEVLKKAISLTPKHANAHFNLAATYANMRQYTDAIDEIKKTLELDPNHILALNLLGEIYLRLGEKTKAKEAFESSLSIKPDQPEIRSKLNKLRLNR